VAVPPVGHHHKGRDVLFRWEQCTTGQCVDSDLWHQCCFIDRLSKKIMPSLVNGIVRIKKLWCVQHALWSPNGSFQEQQHDKHWMQIHLEEFSTVVVSKSLSSTKLENCPGERKWTKRHVLECLKQTKDWVKKANATTQCQLKQDGPLFSLLILHPINRGLWKWRTQRQTWQL